MLRLPRLLELDVSQNQLVAVPPLDLIPQLQLLRLTRNQISSNWIELQVRHLAPPAWRPSERVLRRAVLRVAPRARHLTQPPAMGARQR